MNKEIKNIRKNLIKKIRVEISFIKIQLQSVVGFYTIDFSNKKKK
jgi:hypothetical protein